MSGLIRVLHVDDEPDFADMAASFLEREDERLDVETATSAEEGLDRLAETDYDCVVSDYEMPQTDGIEFLERVREVYPDLPFLLFTGKGSEELASDAISAGVTDYLQKSSDTSQYELLTNRIRNAVDQYRAERHARLQQRQFRDLFENAPIMYVLARHEDGQPVIEDCNDRFVQRLGYDRAEIIGRPTTDFFTEDSAREVYERGGYEQALSGEFGVQERTLISKHGEQIEVLLRASPRLDENGDTIGLQTLYLDITEQKQRERELRKERDRLSALFDDAPQPMIEGEIESSDQYRIIDVNAAFEETFGYDDTEIVGRDIADALVPDDERTDHERFRGRVAAGDSFSAEVERTTSDGERTFLLDVVSYGTETTPADGWFATFTDITERREREKELKLYETMIETVPDGVYALDENFRYVAVNQGMADLTGYSKEELIGSHASLINDEEAMTKAKRGRERLIADGIDDEVMVVEHPHVTADGETVPTEARFRALPPNDDGSFRGTAGVLREISEQKQRERELRQYEELVENLPIGVFRNTPGEEGEWEFANEAMLEFLGVSSKTDLADRSVAEFRPDPDARVEFSQTLIEDGIVKDHEIEIETADGETKWATVTALKVEQDGEIYFDSAIKDITERKKREQELQRERDRLDKFASVVSHDLRNPLNVAEGRLELAHEECNSEHLADVADALDRMDALIEDVLTVAREGTAVKATESIELAAVVDTCWRNVETAGATLAVDTDQTVSADRSRLQQLLENLLRNAVEHGGTDVTITVGDLADGTGFYLEDDGPGIPTDEREQVFESGYSTTQEGTGFGLAIVREIARAHGWEVRLTESVDGGARFEVTGVEMDA